MSLCSDDVIASSLRCVLRIAIRQRTTAKNECCPMRSTEQTESEDVMKNYIFIYATTIKGHFFAQSYRFIRCKQHAIENIREAIEQNGETPVLPEGMTDRPCDDCLDRRGGAINFADADDQWRVDPCTLDDCHQLYRVQRRCCTSGHCWRCHNSGRPGRKREQREAVTQLDRLHLQDAKRVRDAWEGYGSWIEADVDQTKSARKMRWA